eukprot:3434737-Pyramimonas_sp.AAC.1
MFNGRQSEYPNYEADYPPTVQDEEYEKVAIRQFSVPWSDSEAFWEAPDFAGTTGAKRKPDLERRRWDPPTPPPALPFLGPALSLSQAPGGSLKRPPRIRRCPPRNL